MENTHTLADISRAFDNLQDSLKTGRGVSGCDLRLFSEIGFTMEQAMVIAWLLNHKDSVYMVSEMCADLDMEKSEADKILVTLLKRRCLIQTGTDYDVADSYLFTIVDYVTMRERNQVSSWDDYCSRGFRKETKNRRDKVQWYKLRPGKLNDSIADSFYDIVDEETSENTEDSELYDFDDED